MIGQPTRLAIVFVLVAGTLAAANAQAPAPRAGTPEITPKFEVVAETKLLMEGLLLANFRGLETLLKDKPNDNATWAFARGQALLIAEAGNLLLLRPPRNDGRDTWYQKAMELRTTAAELARSASARDFPRSQAAFVELTNSCNRCHKNFRVNVRLSPGERPGRQGD